MPYEAAGSTVLSTLIAWTAWLDSVGSSRLRLLAHGDGVVQPKTGQDERHVQGLLAMESFLLPTVNFVNFVPG